jgi:hypothetical protein
VLDAVQVVDVNGSLLICVSGAFANTGP